MQSIARWYLSKDETHWAFKTGACDFELLGMLSEPDLEESLKYFNLMKMESHAEMYLVVYPGPSVRDF